MSTTSLPSANTARKQVAVLSVAEGFLQSSVLFALVKLRVFARIGDGARTADDLAAEIEANLGALTRVLDAGVALGILEFADGSAYRVASPFREVLVPGAGEDGLESWILNLDYLRDALSRLDQTVLTGLPAVDPAKHLDSDPEAVRDFTLAMHSYAAVRGRELAQFLDTSACKTLLDVGTGPGTYAFHLGETNPALELNLLDLPEVLKVTREVATRYPLANAIHYLPQDALRDEIRGSYDLVLISNTLHMMGERESRKLIQRLYASINPGGSLVVQAQYLADNRQGGRWPAFLDLIQLCITANGRNHTVAETKSWLLDAGFTDVEFCPMSIVNVNSFLRAYRR